MTVKNEEVVEGAAVQGLPSLIEVAAKMSGQGGTSDDPNIPDQGEGGVKEPAAVAEEAPSAKEPPKETAKDPSSSRFAALARKEKDMRRREEALNTRLKEVEARVGSIGEKEASMQRFKQDPLKAMKDLGMSYADITQAVLGNYKAPEEDPLDARFKPVTEKMGKFETDAEHLGRQIEDLRNQLAAKEQREQYSQVMEGIKTASADSDKYELIHSMGEPALDLIKDTMVEYWNQNQKMLDYSEACDIVEQYYEEQFLDRLAKTKKLQTRLQPAAKPAPKPAIKKEAKEPTTLTNRQSSAPEANIDIDKLPKHEALAYLAKKLQFIDNN